MSKKELQKLYYKELQKIGCRVQYRGFSCGTCFFAEKKGLNNKHWRVVLYLRGDHTFKESLEGYVKKEDIERYVIEILNNEVE